MNHNNCIHAVQKACLSEEWDRQFDGIYHQSKKEMTLELNHCMLSLKIKLVNSKS